MSQYQQLAKAILFTSGGLSYDSIKEKFGLQLRKNKTFGDVKSAIEKALKAGRGKTEFELSMLEVYLKQVFKLKKG